MKKIVLFMATALLVATGVVLPSRAQSTGEEPPFCSRINLTNPGEDITNPESMDLWCDEGGFSITVKPGTERFVEKNVRIRKAFIKHTETGAIVAVINYRNLSEPTRRICTVERSLSPIAQPHESVASCVTKP